MAQFHIYHLTKYTYSAPVRESANQLKLYAVQDETQRVNNHQLDITLEPQVEVFNDFWGNKNGIFTITQYHHELKIASTLFVETFAAIPKESDTNPLLHWQQIEKFKALIDFFDFLSLEKFECANQLTAFIEKTNYKNRLPLEVIKEMNHWIFKEFSYIKGITTIDTTLDEIWKLHAGVCQDFAHLLLAMLRMINIPARYVSGYICPNKNGMRGEGATHAWVEAFLPYYGWVGIDPTNNCLVVDGHVKLAVGRNFADCTPVKGFFKGDAEQIMEVAVSVAYDNELASIEIFDKLELQVIDSIPGKTSSISSMQIVQQQ